MILLALVVLTNGILSVPQSHWRAIPVVVPAPGTQVEIDFAVLNGSQVQAWLLTEAEARRFHRGRSVTAICSSGFQSEFRMRCRAPEPGQHVLILDNSIEERRPASVQLRVDLQPPVSAVVHELAPERKRIVIALSLAFFGAVVVLSARQFLKRH